MIEYRITKYDPKKRNPDGSYLDIAEWTSISDIGKPKYRNPSFEDYYCIENAYVNAALLIMQEKRLFKLQIGSLENYCTQENFKKAKSNNTLRSMTVDYKYDIQRLKNGIELKGDKIDRTIRLILREVFWMEFLAKDFEMSFGYDYYMYIKCTELKNKTIMQINKLGLFVESDFR